MSAREGPEKERPSGSQAARPHHKTHVTQAAPAYRTGSATVRWWDFHEQHVLQPYLDVAGDFPLAGTQAWFDLPDTDPAKWAAVLFAASHHVLRMETAQEARCEASRAVSGAADWAAIGREIKTRNDFYRAKPWLKRVSP